MGRQSRGEGKRQRNRGEGKRQRNRGEGKRQRNRGEGKGRAASCELGGIESKGCDSQDSR